MPVAWATENRKSAAPPAVPAMSPQSPSTLVTDEMLPCRSDPVMRDRFSICSEKSSSSVPVSPRRVLMSATAFEMDSKSAGTFVARFLVDSTRASRASPVAPVPTRSVRSTFSNSEPSLNTAAAPAIPRPPIAAPAIFIDLPTLSENLPTFFSAPSRVFFSFFASPRTATLMIDDFLAIRRGRSS